MRKTDNGEFSDAPGSGVAGCCDFQITGVLYNKSIIQWWSMFETHYRALEIIKEYLKK